jgi:2-oxoglutarate ferredoxin oxidoreductase subunit alpha
MAVSAGHGEFPRAVMSVSDAEDSFSLMMDAFNFSEEFQIPVTVLTEKQIAESLFTTEISDQKSVVRRGRLVEGDGLKLLRATDRYDPDAPDGVSARWLPGSDAPTYCAQSYEHNADGSFDESAENAIAQAKKRMKKMEGLKRALPEPEYFGSENTDVLIVSWGSNKNAILDLIEDESVAYLHYTYLWPLKTERLVELAAKAKKTVLVEGNVQGQLGMLIKQECGLEFNERVLKFDGRATGLSNLNLSVL